MSATKQKKIVFVCTGNTCRSPMAEFLLKRELSVRGYRGIQVCSVGLAAKKGEAMNAKSAAVLAEHGIEVGDFTATPLTERLLREAFAFVCMTERQCELLMDMRWNALRKTGAEDIENNVWAFSDIVGYDVLDPYGRDIECYRYVYGLLEGGMSALIAKLELEKHARIVRPRVKKTTDEKSALARENAASCAPKKRGRPRKKENAPSDVPKRGRGRPKKTVEKKGE